MTDTSFLAGQSSIWILPDGPNTKPIYLGCHGVGDITEPMGDVTIKYCPDPAKAGAYVVKNSFRGEPGAVTTSIETDLRKTADYLEDLGFCSVPLYIHKVSCGRRDVFSNFDRSFILRQATISQRSLAGVASRSPDNEDETMQSFDLSAQALTRVFNMQVNRIAITAVEDVTGIAICGEDRCEGDCGPATKATDKMFAPVNHVTGSASSTAEVLASLSGSAWAASASDPFAVEEDIAGIVCFQMGRDTLRVVVARFTADLANPAEIAYSDDYGATWTNVDVGSVNGERSGGAHALFALDRYHLWFGTDDGNIYFSEDAGVTWELQENGAISASAITGISFISPNVGYAVWTGGQVGKTTDGGENWSSLGLSGIGDASDIHVITPYFVWIGGGGGKWYTHDGGTTWAERDDVATAAIDFLDDLVGIAVGSAAQALIYFTIDGGFSWSALPLVTNEGFTDVVLVSSKLAYVTGNAQGGTGLIALVTPEV